MTDAADAPLPSDDRAARAVTAASVCALLAASAVSIITDVDVPWLVRTGQEIVRRRALPSEGLFTHNGHGHTLHHEYLTEVIDAGLYALGGAVGLTVGQCLLMVALVLAMSLVPGRQGRARPFEGLSALPLVVAAMVLRETLSVRAQCFSDVLTALTFALVLRDREGDRRALPLAVSLGALWAQLHGGNPTHTVLLGLGFLASPSRRRLGFAALAALLTCSGPYGPRVHEHYLRGSGSLHLIKEWQPLSTSLLAGDPQALHGVALALLALTVMGLRVRRGERPWTAALALGFYTLMTLRYARMLHELTVIGAMTLAQTAAQLRANDRAWRRAGLSIALSAALVGAFTLRSPRTLGVGFGGRYSAEAFAWLRAHHPPGPMFNSYNLGGWLTLVYDEPVFIDGRGPTVYDDQILRDLLAVYASPSRFEALTARYGFRLAVLQPGGGGASLLRWILTRPEWHMHYRDARVWIFTRDPPPTH